jgi:hypothetical protein
MNKKDIKEMMGKFSISQMTSNTSGKTSASGTMGCIICTAAAICFLWGTFTKQTEVINQSIVYTGIGAGLLGYRKSKEGTDTKISATETPDQPEAKPVEEPVADKKEEETEDQTLNS